MIIKNKEPELMRNNYIIDTIYECIEVPVQQACSVAVSFGMKISQSCVYIITSVTPGEEGRRIAHIYCSTANSIISALNGYILIYRSLK